VQSPCPSYEDLAGLVVSQAAVIREQAGVIASLTARVAEQDERIARHDVRIARQDVRIARQDVRIAELERQVGRSSSNSSQPPSQDGPAAEAEARDGAGDGGQARRRQGGQKGHPGKGLARVAVPTATSPSSHRPVVVAAATWPAPRGWSLPACRSSICRSSRSR
jgi:uncharacterized coiled-coil protein SlyX